MIKVREFWKDAVLQGRKTRSYRPWKRPFRVGSLHECKAGRFQPGFAWVKITRVWKQPLGDVTEQDARNNGYPTRAEMLEHFCLTYAKERAMGKSSAWWKKDPAASARPHRTGSRRVVYGVPRRRPTGGEEPGTQGLVGRA